MFKSVESHKYEQADGVIVGWQNVKISSLSLLTAAHDCTARQEMSDQTWEDL